MNLSVIIPTFNESKALAELLPYLNEQLDAKGEIIVVDGGSTDETPSQAIKSGAQLVSGDVKSRATQMNQGANQASGDVLYFLHADTFPPKGFATLICNALEAGAGAGSFRLKFDWDHWFLNAWASLTRFSPTLFRFGDQSLFVLKDTFHAIGGFDENLAVMEDQEIIKRVKKATPFKVLPETVITSARKYRENGVYRQQGRYALVYLGHYLGIRKKALKQLVEKE